MRESLYMAVCVDFGHMQGLCAACRGDGLGRFLNWTLEKATGSFDTCLQSFPQSWATAGAPRKGVHISITFKNIFHASQLVRGRKWTLGKAVSWIRVRTKVSN